MGQKTHFPIFKAVVAYNDEMGAVDSVDQIRNGKFSFVMQHSGQKYTIRMFAAIDELAETNVYNIY